MRLRNLLGGIGLALGLCLGIPPIANAQTTSTYSCDNGANPPPSTLPGNAQIGPDASEGNVCDLGSLTGPGYIGINTSPGGTINVQGTISAATDADLSTGSAGSITVSGAVLGTSVGITSGTINVGSVTGTTTGVILNADDTLTVNGDVTGSAMNGPGVTIATIETIPMTGTITVTGTIKSTNGDVSIGGGAVNGTTVNLKDISSAGAIGIGDTFGEPAGMITVGKMTAAQSITINNVGDGSTSNTAGPIKINGAVTAGKDQQVNLTGSNITTSGKITVPTSMVSSSPNINITGSGTGVIDLYTIDSSAAATNQPGGSISVVTTGPITVGGAITAQSKGTGSGSAIAISSTGTGSNGLVSVVAAIDASSISGTGGTITVTGGSFSSSLGAVSITSHGKTGGAINLTANDPGGSMVVSNVNASATTATGNSGNITIVSMPTSDLTISGDLLANGGATKGNGGVITATASSITYSGTINANALGTGTSGSVSLTTTSGSFAGSSSPISANGDYGKSTTPSINIVSSGHVTVGALNTNGSNGGTDDGTGGFINISASSSYVQLNGVASAIGSGTGAGGQVVIKSTTNDFTSSSAGIVADAGANATAAKKGGTITVTARTVGVAGPLSANGANLSAGGTITLSSTANTTLAGASANAGSAGNAKGGTIVAQSTGDAAGSITVNGNISATGAGSGRGGSVTLDGIGAATAGVVLNSSQLNVNGGTAGGGGIINVMSGGNAEQSTTVSGSLTAEGGVATPIGQISVSAVGNLIINSTINASALPGSSGAGGKITLASGVNQLSPSYSLNVNAAVSANGGTNGPAGAVTFGSNNVVLASGITVSADANGTGTGGKVTVLRPTGATPGPISVTGQGTLSANLGTVNFNNAAGQSVTVNVASLNGTVLSTGNFISLTEASSNNLVLGNVTASKDVTLENTSSGDIVSAAGDTVKGRTLILQPGTGNIGSSATPLVTSVSGVTSTKQGSASGGVYISNTDTGSGLSVTDGATSGGAFSIQTTGALTVNGITSGGGINLLSGGTAALTVNPILDGSYTLSSTNGAIVLQSGGTIQVGSNDVVDAVGNIDISINVIPPYHCQDTGGTPGPACRPTTAIVNLLSGSLYWGNNGINAPSSFNVTVNNGRTLAFDTNGAAASSIGVANDAQFSAH